MRSLLRLSAVALLACGSSHTADDAGGDAPMADVPAPDVRIDSTGCDPLTDSETGTWTQVMRIDCDGTMVADTGIQELVLDGSRIEVTWTPFETYVDWWGSYATSSEGGIRIDVEGGNYVPDDIDPEGCITVEGGQLILTDVFLGSPSGGGAPGCGHVFAGR